MSLTLKQVDYPEKSESITLCSLLHQKFIDRA